MSKEPRGIAQRVMASIAQHDMIQVAHPTPENGPHTIFWTEASEEQLEAAILNDVDFVIKDRLVQLYTEALTKLGAPDSGDPADLVEWAEETAKKLK